MNYVPGETVCRWCGGYLDDWSEGGLHLSCRSMLALAKNDPRFDPDAFDADELGIDPEDDDA